MFKDANTGSHNGTDIDSMLIRRNDTHRWCLTTHLELRRISQRTNSGTMFSEQVSVSGGL